MNSDKKDYNEFLMYHLSLVVGSTLLSALSPPMLFSDANFYINDSVCRGFSVGTITQCVAPPPTSCTTGDSGTRLQYRRTCRTTTPSPAPPTASSTTMTFDWRAWPRGQGPPRPVTPASPAWRVWRAPPVIRTPCTVSTHTPNEI